MITVPYHTSCRGKTTKFLSSQMLFFTQKNADNLHSLFRETHEYNGFNSYASVKFFHKNPYDMYLGIKHNGKMKRAMKSDRVRLLNFSSYLQSNSTLERCKIRKFARFVSFHFVSFHCILFHSISQIKHSLQINIS